MKKRFTIGEFAKLSFVSAHTLRFYDKIGLLKPGYIDRNNGYRYYTYEDFMFLDTIKYMRKIGMPLDEIKQHFENRTADKTLELYRKRLDEAESRIKELTNIKLHIEKNIGYLEKSKALTGPFEPQLIELEERHAITASADAESVDIGNPFDTGAQFNMLMCSITEMLYREDLRTMGHEFVMKPAEALLAGDFTKAAAVGDMLTETPFDPEDDPMIEKVPAGTYGCIYHAGATEKIDRSYKKLLKYIDDKGYEIHGNSYELLVVDAVDTSLEEEYLTQIQILLKKRE